MNMLATELHSAIVNYCARIDDGSTIRALSRVSRYYRGLALSRIHETICLNIENIAKINLIQKLVEELKLEARRSPSGTADVIHLAVNIGYFDLDNPSDLAKALKRILENCAAALQTLSFTFSDDFLVPGSNFLSRAAEHLFSLSFPELLQLALFGPITVWNNVRPNAMGGFPSLRKAHDRDKTSALQR